MLIEILTGISVASVAASTYNYVKAREAMKLSHAVKEFAASAQDARDSALEAKEQAEAAAQKTEDLAGLAASHVRAAEAHVASAQKSATVLKSRASYANCSLCGSKVVKYFIRDGAIVCASCDHVGFLASLKG
jgi:NADH pyrophosphatase NudC (nudix superfamily)